MCGQIDPDELVACRHNIVRCIRNRSSGGGKGVIGWAGKGLQGVLRGTERGWVEGEEGVVGEIHTCDMEVRMMALCFCYFADEVKVIKRLDKVFGFEFFRDHGFVVGKGPASHEFHSL